MFTSRFRDTEKKTRAGVPKLTGGVVRPNEETEKPSNCFGISFIKLDIERKKKKTEDEKREIGSGVYRRQGELIKFSDRQT